MGPKKKPPDIPKVNHQPINYKFGNFCETDTFQRYLVIKPKEDTNDLISISLFSLNKELGKFGIIQSKKKQNH